MLPTKFRFIFARHFRGEDFYQIQQKQELPLHLWKFLLKEGLFYPDPFTNMATTGNSCF
jgi:hypothetical protein